MRVVYEITRKDENEEIRRRIVASSEGYEVQEKEGNTWKPLETFTRLDQALARLDEM